MQCWVGNVINTMDLLTAASEKPVEVFKLFKTSLDRSGKSFDNFSAAEKRAIAEATKMDVDQLNSLFKVDLRTGIEQLNKMAEEEQDLKKAAEEAAALTEKLYKIFYIFVGYLTPVVKKLHEVVDDFHKWIQKNKETAKTLGLVLTVAAALTLGLTILAKAWVLVSAAMISIKTIFPGKKSAVDLLAGAGSGASSGPSRLAKLGQAATSSAKGLLSFGAAILLIGAGIAVAAVGIAQMVKSFKDLNPEQINRSCNSIGNIRSNVYCLNVCCF